MNTFNKVAKNTSILYFRMALTVIISLYSTRLILNALGASDFGVFNVVAGLVSMLTFLNTSMASSTQRFMSYTLGEGKSSNLIKTFNVSVIIHFIIGVIVVLLIEFIGYFLFESFLNIQSDRIFVAKFIFHFTVLGAFFTIISLPYEATLNAHENFLFVAILAFINVFLKLLIAIYLTYSSFDKLILYGILMAIVAIILFLVKWSYCRKHYLECQINLKKNYDKQLLIKMTNFAGWSFLATTVSMITNYGKGLIINKFFGTILNAAQGVAGQLGGQINVLTSTLFNVLNPVMVKSEGAGDRAGMLKTAVWGSKASFFLIMFFYVPLLIETNYIFTVWLKNVPEYTVLFCQLSLVGSLIEQIFVPLVTAISAVGNIKNYKIWASILSFFPLIVSYILFTRGFPVYSIYIVFIIYTVFDSYLILSFTNKNCGLSKSYFIKNNVLRCLSVFSLVLFIAYTPCLFLPEGFGRMIFVLLFSSSSFFLFIWLLGLNNEEKEQVLKLSKLVLNKVVNKNN